MEVADQFKLIAGLRYCTITVASYYGFTPASPLSTQRRDIIFNTHESFLTQQARAADADKNYSA